MQLIDEASQGKTLGKSDMKDDNGGVTWAFEVAGQTVVCPIIVEDMNPPGQMLIEVRNENTSLVLLCLLDDVKRKCKEHRDFVHCRSSVRTRVCSLR